MSEKATAPSEAEISVPSGFSFAAFLGTHGNRIGAAALIAAQVPWFVISVLQIRHEAGPLGMANLGLSVGFVVLGVGLWRGDRWSLGPAVTAAYGEVIWSAMWAFRGTPVLWPSAALAFVAAVAFNAARPKPAAAKAGGSPGGVPAPPSFGLWLRENAEAIVVAFIMALVIRCFCIEVFKIPSSSMEPTLLGDVSAGQHPREDCDFGPYHVYPGGDRIMVTKYYYAASSVERYDVVVFKFPLNQSRNFIKRVVGLPGEKILIHRGNLYARRPEEDQFQIVRRTLRTQDSMWIRIGPPGGFLAKRTDFDESWDRAGGKAGVQIQDSELTTEERDGARDAQFEYRLDKSPIRDKDGGPVGELHLAFDFELTGPRGEVFAEIANEYGRFEARLSTDGESQLRVHLPEKEQVQPLKGVRLAMDRTTRLALSIYDGMAVARVDGKVAGEVPFITTRDRVIVHEHPARRVAFGARDVTFKVRNLELGRDIYYRGRGDRTHGLREDEPYPPKPEDPSKPDEFLTGYVMMGDNVSNSHDSRAWTKRSFTLEDGTEIRCEGQEVDNYKAASPEEVMKKYELGTRPDTVIAADEFGNVWALYDRDPGDLKGRPFAGVLARDKDGNRMEKSEALREIESKFIVGKGLWIWWPPGRWFKLIR